MYACVHHADQRRKSGEDFIIHPVGVAKICAGMRLDTETLCAALLHDTVEDTSASLEEVQEAFGEEIASLVDGVTKLTGPDVPVARRGAGRELPQDDGRDGDGHPRHPDQAGRPPAQHAHDRRRWPSRSRSRRHARRSTSTRRSPTASVSTRSSGSSRTCRFQALHPRKYNEIKGLVAQQRAERERYVNQAGELPVQGARRARDRGRDLRPRQALLLDLLEDDQEGARVQRDLRPHRDAGDRRARSRTATAPSA